MGASNTKIVNTGQSEAFRNATPYAEEVLNQPYQAYGGEMVAPETANEMAAGGMATSVQSDAAPFYQAAGTTFGQGSLSDYYNPNTQAAINPALAQESLQTGEQLAAQRRGEGEGTGFGRTAANEGATELTGMQTQGSTEIGGLENAAGAATSGFNTTAGANLTAGKDITASDIGDIGTLQSSGMNQRSVAQAQDTSNYTQFERQQNWAGTELQPFIGTLQAVKGGQVSETSSNPQQWLTNVSSAASLGYGMYGMATDGVDTSNAGQTLQDEAEQGQAQTALEAEQGLNSYSPDTSSTMSDLSQAGSDVSIADNSLDDLSDFTD
jgi:hypothetical protein